MMARSKATLRRLALCVSLWIVCLASVLFNPSKVIAPQGHDWQLMVFPVYILWQCTQWLGVIAMPFYIAVVIAQHKRGT